MFTLEQKVDLILRYIATTDKSQQRELRKLVVEALNADAATISAPAPRALNDEVIEDLIVDLLKEVGARQHLVGYDYIIYAITLTLEDRSYLKAITTRLYPDIAERFDTTCMRVERNIRHSVEVIFRNSDFEGLERIFGNSMDLAKGKVINSEFIATCVNEIARRMKKQGIAL